MLGLIGKKLGQTQVYDAQGNVVAFYNAVEDPADTPLPNNSVAGAFDHVGHGSHVSGIAASTNPSIGVAYKASLIDIHAVADPGESQLGGSAVLRGLQWVEQHAQQFNIRVVNMSLGVSANIIDASFQALVDSITYKLMKSGAA